MIKSKEVEESLNYLKSSYGWYEKTNKAISIIVNYIKELEDIYERNEDDGK